VPLLNLYGYSYDNLNRLTRAVYEKTGNTMPVTHMYDESMTYDVNGNIQSLQRNGDFDSNTLMPIEIDDLAYTYDTNIKRNVSDVWVLYF
jgi:hypothetical protein